MELGDQVLYLKIKTLIKKLGPPKGPFYIYGKIKVMLYNTSDPKIVYREIKKLQPLNYNQFKWWRRFDTKVKPLPKGAKFFDRIKNGEYEFSHYFWQWKLTELELNEKHIEYRGDIQKLLEKNGVDLARRKRLIEDFEKDEAARLKALLDGFLREFDMTKEDYYLHLENFNGTTEEFYMYCLKTFDRTGKQPDKRGRPKKITYDN